METSYKIMGSEDKVELDETQSLRFTCCDCGLVHDIKTTTKTTLIFKGNNRATGQQRRWRRIKLVWEAGG